MALKLLATSEDDKGERESPYLKSLLVIDIAIWCTINHDPMSPLGMSGACTTLLWTLTSRLD